LDEYSLTADACAAQLYSQQRQFGHSTENLDITPVDKSFGFTDLNRHISKKLYQTIPSTFKIDFVCFHIENYSVFFHSIELF